MKTEYDVAITIGVFDLLHRGHAELFALMASKAKEMHVVVHDDLSTFINKGRFPVQHAGHRVRNITKAFRPNHTYVTDQPDPSADAERVVKAIRAGRPKARICFVRGDDWKDAPAIPKLRELGVTVIFKEYTKGVSTTERRKEFA